MCVVKSYLHCYVKDYWTIGHLLPPMDTGHSHHQHNTEDHRPGEDEGLDLINKPPCCTLALAMLQLLPAPSDPHSAQKKIQPAVACAPSSGEVVAQY